VLAETSGLVSQLKKANILFLPDGAAQATAVVVGAGSIPVQATLLWRAGLFEPVPFQR